MQGQADLVGRYVARDQFEYYVPPILAPLAHQHPIITALPVQRQANGYAKVGQLQRKPLGVGDLDRAAFLQGLCKVQGPADRLVAQPFGRGLDKQRQGFKVTGVFANQRTRHVGSFLRRGRPHRRLQRLRRTCATVATLWARCSGLMVPTIALATPGWPNTSSKLARTGSTPGLRQT